ncbi:hypothetical protein AQUSIP_22080 [Aquicella siphonis]|uniref:Lipopeptide n=1 Tax=Aquicella siphonis TaxID=254247 RepID=A0A5E4PKF2_9COXI|nr:lipoprotein [Aquicella siphonis]VVC76881.1 hypothetical protein AQUSIP_22080 [Aquicella siphonis]
MRRLTGYFIIILISINMLSACGQSGKLYLPDEKSQNHAQKPD